MGHEIVASRGVSCVRFIPSGGEGGHISRQEPGSSEGRACSEATNPSSPPLFSSCHSYQRRVMSRPPPHLQIPRLHPRLPHPPHLRACRRRLRACRLHPHRLMLNLYTMICTRTLWNACTLNIQNTQVKPSLSFLLCVIFLLHFWERKNITRIVNAVPCHSLSYIWKYFIFSLQVWRWVGRLRPLQDDQDQGGETGHWRLWVPGRSLRDFFDQVVSFQERKNITKPCSRADFPPGNWWLLNIDKFCEYSWKQKLRYLNRNNLVVEGAQTLCGRTSEAEKHDRRSSQVNFIVKHWPYPVYRP